MHLEKLEGVCITIDEDYLQENCIRKRRLATTPAPPAGEKCCISQGTFRKSAVCRDLILFCSVLVLSYDVVWPFWKRSPGRAFVGGLSEKRCGTLADGCFHGLEYA